MLLMVVLGLVTGNYAQDTKKPETKQVIKMNDIKQTVLGLEKEHSTGDLIRLKISPLPTSPNVITAIYKLILLENGKISPNAEVLTKVERSTEPRKSEADFIFTVKAVEGIKYQVIFAVTYIETKPGTAEILDTYSPQISVYDVKLSGVMPEPNPDIPPGNYGMIKAIYQECQKLPFNKATKAVLFTNLANSFSGMQSKIAAGIFKDSDVEAEQAENINKFLTDSKLSNNAAIEEAKVDRTKFDGTIDVIVKAKMAEMFANDKLRKFAEYQGLWAEIAEGFKLAAKGL